MNMTEIFKKQSLFFSSGTTKSISWRKQQLKTLKSMLIRDADLLQKSLRDDLGKPAFEAFGSEIAIVTAEIDRVLKQLERWSRTVSVSSRLLSFHSRSVYYPVPYGSVLIIGPWNYPVGLLLLPLVAAIAAGNCAVLKPSEYAPASSAAITKCISSSFSETFVSVCEAGAVETARVIESGAPDYVFFTGGSSAGKQVMVSCAHQLIPSTLELGGSNPCIIEPDIPARIAAQRIVWGKFFNAGQTCLAPNICYVNSMIYDKFKDALLSAISKFYGDRKCPESYTRIINQRHFDRIQLLMKKTKGIVLTGGESNQELLCIEPTVVLCDPDINDPLLSEEIFGPILPIVPYTDIEQVVKTINTMGEPLVVYLFSEDRNTQKFIRNRTVSGSYCINGFRDLYSSGTLPFGGVGQSGTGRYHGKSGFDTFSYLRSEVRESFFPEIPLLYTSYRMPFSIFKKAIAFLLR